MRGRGKNFVKRNFVPLQLPISVYSFSRSGGEKLKRG